MKKIILILIASSIAAAAEPTLEQLELMRQYHLSVPPIIKGIDGKELKLSDPVNDIRHETIERPRVDLIIEKILALPIKRIDVRTVEQGKQIDVVFIPWGEAVELPIKHDIILVTDGNFKSQVEKYSGTILVDFYAEWCSPCRSLSPIIADLAKDISIRVAKADFDKSTTAASRYGVRSLPCLILFVNGKVTASRIGYAPKEDIRAWLDSETHAVKTTPSRDSPGPTAEQLKLMKEFHLTIPPTIIGDH